MSVQEIETPATEPPQGERAHKIVHYREKPRFQPTKGFQHELKSRVEKYFQETGKTKRDSPQIYIKAVIILMWLAASYALSIFVPLPWWGNFLALTSLALSIAAVGFNIQHDGGHQAFSENKHVNRIAALTVDLIGGSSYMWNFKHNTLHHTYSNVQGHDDDIELGFLGRLCPHQKHLWFHRFQQIYLWFLYGFITLKWYFVDDYVNMALGRYGENKIPRPKGWDLVIFFGGKLVFYGFALVIPLMYHSWWMVALSFLYVMYLEGWVLSVVFQMAHIIEEAEFPLPVDDPYRIENEWMIHQLETTVDFARDSKILNWYVGGLNFQVEHHLFPRISHVHYPAIAKIVEQTCKEFGVTYNAHKSMWASMCSHYRLLKKLGTGWSPTPAAQAAA